MGWSEVGLSSNCEHSMPGELFRLLLFTKQEATVPLPVLYLDDLRKT